MERKGMLMKVCLMEIALPRIKDWDKMEGDTQS
jgi:hypothetical protein